MARIEQIGRQRKPKLPPPSPASPPRIGLALGGGFARGIAHIGVLKVLRDAGIPVDVITGVSAGAVVAAAFASGSTPEHIEQMALRMKIWDVARWNVGRFGLLGNDRMGMMLQQLLHCSTFEEMRIPLGVVATDLLAGAAVVFQGHGEVTSPIRASCAFPGLFQPVRFQDRLLTDGAMSMEVPALAARTMGATKVISVCLPFEDLGEISNALAVINRCFQILQSRTEETWRRHSDVVISPMVNAVPWHAFGHSAELIEAGRVAAQAALPAIQKWLGSTTAPTVSGRLQQAG